MVMRSRSVVQLIVVSLALVVAPLAGARGKLTFPATPLSGTFSTDAAGLISKEHSSEIDGLAAALLAEKGYPVRVVTIRSLAAQGAAGYTVDQYAAELLQSWRNEQRLGQYGMLLLVAADDRTARIQLGSAWGQAHDGRARQIMDRLILPAFRKGEFSAGILNGVRGFDAMGRQLAMPMANQPSWLPPAVAGLLDQPWLTLDTGTSGQPWWMLPALAAGGLALLVGLVSVARRGRKSWAWAAAAFVFGIFLSRAVSAARGGGDSGGGATGEW
jgi:uncharacterized protein